MSIFIYTFHALHKRIKFHMKHLFIILLEKKLEKFLENLFRIFRNQFEYLTTKICLNCLHHQKQTARGPTLSHRLVTLRLVLDPLLFHSMGYCDKR